jgi:sister-chromatid-cohesion protein PDS5
MPPKKVQPAAVYLAPGFLVAAKSSEIQARMKGCFEFVKSIEQCEPEKVPPGLENIASQLLHDSLRNSKYAEVRCLAAQCVVELLRIYAPNPPYDTAELKVSARVDVSG